MIHELYKRIHSHYDMDGLVFGGGSMKSGILLIGEAPGKDEVKQGRPFVGQAGKNLDGFLDILGLPREDIYITNVCKFRPCKTSEKGTVSNRPPTQKEITEAIPFLQEEIGILQPKTIVTLGNTPLRAVLDDKSASIGVFHGKTTQTQVGGQAYRLFALYHPASIIYNRSLKEVYEKDLYALKSALCPATQ
ncbi:MAG: uracil-DNA glycosylase [Christensenellaceae bacterium]|jgi:uracil-DNA glycosylase family 4